MLMVYMLIAWDNIIDENFALYRNRMNHMEREYNH